MTEREIKDFSNLIFEMKQTMDTMHNHAKKATPETFDSAWYVKALNAIRRAVLLTLEDLQPEAKPEESTVVYPERALDIDNAIDKSGDDY